MKSAMRRYAIGICVAVVSSVAAALPFSVTGDSGLPGQPVTVTLNDALTASTLDSVTVLVQFDPLRLDYVTSVLGTMFPFGSSIFENLNDEASGRVIVSLSSDANPLASTSGSLLDVNFDILANAPVGLTEVTFRCVPSQDPNAAQPSPPVDAVTDQASADRLCAADYAIPATSGNVNVLAPSSTPIPVAGTLGLVLLGCGVIGSIRRIAQP